MVSQLTNGLYHATDPTEDEFLALIVSPGDKTHYNPKLFGLYSKTDAETLELLPPRSKICVGMRRLRLSSLAKANRTLSDAILPYLSELPYELATNILVWSICHGVESFLRLKMLGYFNSYDDFLELSRQAGYMVKVYEESFELKHKYAELNNLCGYMMVDDTFDIKEESRSLAHGPVYDSKIRTLMFRPMLQDLMGSALILPKTNLSFEEYVKGGHWLTSGSSSIGRVNWELDGKEKHFKARKNMLVDIYSPEELWDIVVNWDGVIRNKPLVKNELAKMRLAVASNIESYLHEAYMMELIGHEYVNWEYITLDESESSYCSRTSRLITELDNGCYALPWDFKSFDHQATTYEIQSILSNMFSKLAMTSDQVAVAGKILASYGKGIIYQDRQEPKFEFEIKGGLQSGQRITSLIGNIWNAVITKSALWVAKHLCPDLHIGEVALRGDDTYILTKTALNAYYIRLAYASMFALGNDAKFSIRQKSCEFLRSEITTREATAWLNRSIPSITQRKPWSDKPWDPVREVLVIADNIRTAERRRRNPLGTIHLANKQQWSKFTHQSYHYLSLPTRLGGLGVYEFHGWVADCRIPPTARPNVKVTSKLEGRMPGYLTKLVNEEDYLSGSLKSKMQPGDVAGDFVNMTRKYIDSVRRLKPKWILDLDKIRVKIKILDRISNKVSTVEPRPPTYQFPRTKPRVDLRSTCEGWPPYTRFLSDYGKINTVIKRTLGSLTQEYYPNVWRKMKNYEARGFHRTDAISLVLGDTPSSVNFYTNSRLTGLVKESIREEILQYKGRENIAIAMSNLTSYAARELARRTINTLFNF